MTDELDGLGQTETAGLAHMRNRATNTPMCEGTKGPNDKWARQWSQVTCEGCKATEGVYATNRPVAEQKLRMTEAGSYNTVYDKPNEEEATSEPIEIDPEVANYLVNRTVRMAVGIVCLKTHKGPPKAQSVGMLSMGVVQSLVKYNIPIDHPLIVVAVGASMIAVELSNADTISDEDELKAKVSAFVEEQ